MRKCETIGLEGVIQERRFREERRGGDRWRWIATSSSLPPLQSRTMRRSTNLSPDDEGSLWRPLSSTLKLSHTPILQLSLSTSSALSHLSEM